MPRRLASFTRLIMFEPLPAPVMPNFVPLRKSGRSMGGEIGAHPVTRVIET
jgi:hypothetical protein